VKVKKFFPLEVAIAKFNPQSLNHIRRKLLQYYCIGNCTGYKKLLTNEIFDLPNVLNSNTILEKTVNEFVNITFLPRDTTECRDISHNTVLAPFLNIVRRYNEVCKII